MASDTVTLLAVCVNCERPVTLAYYALKQSAPTMYSWTCPYAKCGQLNTVGVHGSQPVPTAGPSTDG